MTEETIRMVELEEQIADDSSGELRNELCRELTDEHAKLKQAMDRGLTPGEFEQAQSVLEALDAAQKVVKTMWTSAHRNTGK